MAEGKGKVGFNFDGSQDPAMEQATKKMQSMRQTIDEDVKQTGVPQSVFLRYIKSELDNERNCLELPLTILILMSFSILAICLLRQDKVFTIEDALELDIEENANFAWAHTFGHKGLIDVNCIADFWSWLRVGFLPLAVQPVWYYSEGYPEALGQPVTHGTNYSQDALPKSWLFQGYDKPVPIKNDYLRLNRMIGGIRMSQEVADKTALSECRFPTSIDRARMEAWLGKPCTPSDLATLSPEKLDTEVWDRFTRTQWLLPEIDSLEEIYRVALDMEDGCAHSAAGSSSSACRCDWCSQQNPLQPWLDEQTRRVEIAFISYNPHYGLYSYVGTNFFFNRGGHIHKKINVASAWQAPFGSTISEVLPVYVTGTFWLAALLYVMVTETREIISVVRGAGLGRCWTALKEDYFGPWNIVDWVSICVGLAALSCFLRMRFAISTVNSVMGEMIDASLHLTNNRPAYLAATEGFFEKVLSMCSKEKDFRMCLYIYPNIIMLRLFKSFAAQPRLAIVTLTLQRASVDLLHFGIVFVAVYLCMMVNSILFFGQDLEMFSTFPRAFHSCFLAMFGDWDWNALKEIGYFKAQVWFWLFLVINVLILLNMLLAIIMDAYTAEKVKAGSAVSLWEQTFQMRRRRLEFKRKERVRLNDIWDVFLAEANGDEKAILKNERLVTAELLLENVPRIPSKQANRLLVKSVEHERKFHTADISEEDIKESIKNGIMKADTRASDITENVRSIAQLVNLYDCLEVAGDPEYDSNFGANVKTPSGRSQESVEHAVTALSSEISGVVVNGLKRIESWQESFENQQSEMHAVLTELHNMVTQQADCLSVVSESVNQLELINWQSGNGG